VAYVITTIHATSNFPGTPHLNSPAGSRGSRGSPSPYLHGILQKINAKGLTRPELIIFDCDGVLVDSEMLSCRIEEDLFHDIGLSISTGEIRARFVGLNYETMAQQIESDYGVRLPDDFEARCLDRFSQAIETDLNAVSGIPELLATMPCPICLASSSPLTRIAKSLAVTGLTDHFAGRIFSAQMVSRGKPAPDLFLLAAQECAAEPDNCLVVEDSTHGIRAAVAAGMSSVGFTAGSHCSATQSDALAAAGADLLAADSRQLASILNALCHVKT
jgi:HAD superfamily hydrolase (TIGR01509 family)|tara:strand:- start:1480 stop:2301 length:822 start_codon:yes stop_codon:yes gene_type:complete